MQNLYKIGMINYPRVDNTFIEHNKAYDMHAHPGLTYSAKIFDGLKGEIITLNKKSATLFLSLIRVLSPSNIITYAELIDDFYEDDLAFVSKEKEKEANKLIQTLSTFMDESGITQEEIIKRYRSIFEESKKRRVSHYAIGNMEFRSPGPTRIHKIIPGSKPLFEGNIEEMNVDGAEYYEVIKKKKSILEALCEYDRMKQAELEMARKLSENITRITGRK